MELLPEVREVLEACGWSEKRRVDTMPFQQTVEAAGFYWHAAGADFLSRFGRLQTQAPATGETVTFDPCSLFRIECPENIVGASRQVGSRLCPIGTLNDIGLLIDEEGAVYCEFAGWMAFLGYTPEGGLNALLARQMPQWPAVPEYGWSKPREGT